MDLTTCPSPILYMHFPEIIQVLNGSRLPGSSVTVVHIRQVDEAHKGAFLVQVKGRHFGDRTSLAASIQFRMRQDAWKRLSTGFV